MSRSRRHRPGQGTSRWRVTCTVAWFTIGSVAPTSACQPAEQHIQTLSESSSPAASTTGSATVSMPLSMSTATSAVLTEGEVLLGVRGQSLLLGNLADAPPNADPMLRMQLVGDAAGKEASWVQRGRWLPDGALLITDVRGQLKEVSADRTRLLDSQVNGPVGASLDGRWLAYSVGEAPELEIVVRDRRAATSQAVTVNMAPCWGPAVSPDGREVVFVSAHQGSPQWWVQPLDDAGRSAGPPRALTAPGAAPTAASLAPTLVSANHITFGGHDEHGFALHVLARDGRVLKTLRDARMPHWRQPGDVVVYRRADGRLAELVLSEVGQ